VNEKYSKGSSQERILTVYFALERFIGLFCESGTKWNYGGAEMQMYYLARSFAALPGVQVVLLTSKPDLTSIYPGISIRQIKKYPRTGNIIGRLRQKHVPGPIVWLAEKYIERSNMRRRHNLFEEHTGRSVMLISSFERTDVVRAASLHGIKVVYRVSGDSLVDGTYAPEVITRIRTDQLFDLSDAVVVQSEYQQRAFQENYNRDATIIASGFSWSDPLQGPRKKQVLWVGRCVAIKRPWLLLALAHRLPQADFAFIAPPPDDELFLEMEREACKLDNVTLIPGVARSEITRYYAESAVVVNTSFSEGMPNTLIEACAAETPYVSYSLDIGGLLGEEGIGDCAQGDMERFVELVDQYLDSDERRAEVGKKAYEYARRTWNIQTATDSYIELFSELLRAG